MTEFVKRGWTRHMALALCAAAFTVLSGCGEDDNNAVSSSPYVGTFSGAVEFDDGETGTLAMTTQANGQATGTLTIDDGGTATAPFRSAITIPIVTIPLVGTLNVGNGSFSLTGQYTDGGGHSVPVQVTGIVPGPGQGGSFNVTIAGVTYSSSLSPGSPAVATATPVPANPTATPTRTHTPVSGTATATQVGGNPTTTPTATPTATSNVSNATPTPEIVPPGISTLLLGTFSGEAKNESIGAQKSVRISIQVQGGTVVVTDLGGNLFRSGSSISPTVATTTTLTSVRNVGGFPGGYLETLQLALIPDSATLGGIYSAVPLTNPTDMSNSFGLVLHRE